MSLFSNHSSKRRFSTIRMKLGITITLLIGVISIFISIYFPARQQKQALDAMDAKAYSIARMTAFSLSSALYFEDIAGIDEALEGAKQNRDLVYIVVLNDSGRVLSGINEDKTEPQDFALSNTYPHISPDGKIYEVMTPILIKGKQIGRLYLGLSLEELRSEVAKSRATIVLVSLLIFLVGINVVFGISAIFTRPLSRMVETVRQISKGDLSQRAIITSRDEVGLLARSFNLMVDNLESTYSKLENINQNLEKRVEERIKDLQKEVEERKRTAEALQQQQQEQQILLDHIPAMIFYKDAQNRFIRVNRTLAETTGMPIERIEGKPCDEVFPAQSQEYWQDDQEVIESGQPKRNIIEPLETANGIRWLQTDKIPNRDEKGNIIGIVGFSVDITERKQMEEKLQESEEKFRTIFDSTSDGMFLIDLEAKTFSICNKSCLQMLGYTMEEFVNLAIEDLHFREDIPFIYAQLEEFIKGGKGISHDIRFKRKDGSIFFTDLSPTLLILGGKRFVLVAIKDTTERKQAEEALKESEEKYRTLLETTDTGFCIMDAQGNILDTNPEYVRLSGHSTLEEILGRSVIEWTAKYDLERNAVEVNKCIQQGYVRNLEIDYVDKTDKATPIEINATVIQTEKGPRILTLCRDITVRRQTEEDLKKSEEKYRTLIENQGEGVALADTNEKFVFANPAADRIFGVSPGGLIGRSISEFTTPEQFANIQEQTKNRRTGVKNSYEAEILSLDGVKRFLLITGAPHYDLNGIFDGTFGVLRDITDRKQAEEELLESEKKYRDLVENIGDVIYSSDSEGKLTYVSPAIKSLAGYDPQELMGQVFLRLVHPDDLPRVMQEIQKIQKGNHIRSEVRIFKKSGEIRWISASNRPVFEKDEFIGLQGILTDITERKQAEDELKNRESFLETIIDNIPNMLFVKDAQELRFVRFNKAGEDLLGYSRNDMIGKSDHDFFPKDEADSFTNKDKDVLAKKNLIDIPEELIQTKHRGKRLLHTRKIPILDEYGNPQYLLGISEDITERKRAEEELRQAKEKAEESNRLKSEFLANMSHEIRTPMNAVIGMTGITLDTNLTSEQREYLDIVKESAYALLGLLDDILDFSKIEAGKVDLETIDFDLRTVMEGVADTLSHRASTKGVELAYSIHREVPVFLRGDPVRLRQILMNLGGNAIKFTEKGEVVIRSELKEETNNSATILFSVTDTGIGIPLDKQTSIFESFTQLDGSTTRKYGGTGLGLSISKRLVELMGGHIGVESQPGAGSRFWFTVTLEKQKEPKKVPSLIPFNLQEKRTLIVDDNQTNRTILVKMLESFGCTPEAVKSGTEALSALKKGVRQKRPYHLVLLDMRMPGMDGEQTLLAIKKDPKIKDVSVIVLTSLGVRGEVARLEASGCAGYLLKPVKQSQLFDTIITVLGQEKVKREGEVMPIVTRHIMAEPKFKNTHILVAEDNPMNMKLAVTLLNRAGFSVDAVENGKLAIVALKKTVYDLVFMDVQMPEMDGIEATKIIREMEGEEKHTPIIAMTAHAMKGDRERCLKAGMDDYVSKPIEPQEMFKVIEKWTKLSGKKGRTLPEDRSEKKKDIMDIPLDMETTLRRFDGDKDFFREMMLEFLEYVPKQLQILNEAVKKGDAKLVERESHSLKGAAGNMGANALVEWANQLELLGRKFDLDSAKKLMENLKTDTERLKMYVEEMLGEVTTIKTQI